MAYLFRGYLDTPPKAPQKDNVFFNKTSKKLYRYDGEKWVEFDPNMKIYNSELRPADPYKAYDKAMDVI